MEVMSHPQMLALQQLCLSSKQDQRIFFGQVNLNSKKAGYAGGGWHSHWTGGGTDGVGKPNLCTSRADYMRENLQNLNLTCQCFFPSPDAQCHGPYRAEDCIHLSCAVTSLHSTYLTLR
jgi:hypothetical protein